MSDRPLVRVGCPSLRVNETEREPVPEALVLSCSACGDLTDWESLGARRQLQYQAQLHARTEHDDDVDAEGWAR